MKERNWKNLAEELQELLNYSGYEGTKVKVEVSGEGLEITAANKDIDTFYHPEALTDFCRSNRLLSYAKIKEGKLVYRAY